MERLQKFIARSGYCSRRRAQELITLGKVTVNGKTSPANGILINPEEDVVVVDGSHIALSEKKLYYLLNKPQGYTSTLSDPHADHLITELLPPLSRVYPAGRLDRDSSGLIILTNDGDFANKMTHPSFGHEKEYEVYAVWKKTVPGNTEGRRLLEKISRGVVLDGYKTFPAEIEIRKFDSKGVFFKITLHEGRNRQIRKMCKLIDLEVKMLTRTRIGFLTCEGLLPGDYRTLTDEELKKLC